MCKSVAYYAIFQVLQGNLNLEQKKPMEQRAIKKQKTNKKTQ